MDIDWKNCFLYIYIISISNMKDAKVNFQFFNTRIFRFCCTAAIVLKLCQTLSSVSSLVTRNLGLMSEQYFAIREF